MMLEILKVFATVVGVVAALWGIYVYFLNSRLRRAQWLASLYEKFYERPDLKGVRETLDCEGAESPNVRQLIQDEPSQFTDYLNFFEFVAVLQKSGQLTNEEIEDLFRYYLDCLERLRAIREYIAAKGYEQLDKIAA